MIDKFETYDLEIKGLRLPEVDLQHEDYEIAGVKEGVDSEEFLRSLSVSGLKELGKHGDKEYLERLDYELDVYSKTGFTDYIILIWDIINFCKKKDIPVGKGRGSCPASLVLYSIGVTGIDPMKYGLYFERFVSETRAKSQVIDGVRYIDGLMAPDVDLDIAHDRRQEVSEYLFEKYPNRCCKLSTVATLKGKMVLKECVKIVGGYDNELAEELAKAVPARFGKVFTIQEARKDSKKLDEFFDENPKVYEIAVQIQGLIKNKSSHASGYLVAYDEHILNEIIPLELGKEKDGTPVLISSFDMNYAQILCIKVDLLGLQDLSLLARVCDRIGIDYRKIDPESPDIYKHFQNNLPTPYGLFQIGADCNFQVLNKVRPNRLSELAAVISLARPGALAYVDKYAEYLQTGKFKSVHEFFDETLKPTGSIPIFQEDLIRMSTELGFSPSEGEQLRRIVGKKKVKEAKEWKKKIEDKIKERDLPKEVGEVLWKVVEDSANYSFNLSHAVAYATLSAASTYAKFKYPQEFYIECLNAAEQKADNREEISLINKELGHFDIKILPPDLSKSQIDFMKEGKDIRYGLKSIKGISDKSVDALQAFVSRERNNKFQVFNAASASGLNIGILSAIIQAGTLDSLITKRDTRTSLVYEAQLFNLLTQREKTYALEHGHEYDYSVFDLIRDMPNWLTETGKKMIRPTRMETINTRADTYRKIFRQNNSFPEFANYVYEQKVLGYSHSTSLKQVCMGAGEDGLMDAKEFAESEDYMCRVVGEVEDIKYTKSKAGKKYLKIDLGDDTGTVTCMMFEPDVFEFAKKDVFEKIEEGSRMIISGKRWNDALIISTVKLLDEQIYMKLSDLKNEK